MAEGGLNAKGTIEIDTSKATHNVKNLTQATDGLTRAARAAGAATDTLSGTSAGAGRSIERTASSLNRVNGSIVTQRYALYDVASSWTVLATASLGAAAAIEATGIAFESAFAQVERTTGVAGVAVGQMKDELEDLTTIIPTSFQDIAGIAALGGQLGIAADGITEFTAVVAKLTATTDLSSQAAGTALGRFQALLGTSTDEFDNVASSILKVGVNSVATESQIVNTATQISSMGRFAGFTADQVVGLSGALASVGTQPELARGTITRTFTLISKAVAEGGDKLNLFAKLSGTTADQFAQAWGTDKFANVFQKLLSGIGDQGGKSVEILNQLGITSVRDVPALLRLAGATDVVSRAFDDAQSGFADNTELNRQFGIIAETTASKLKDFGNSIKATFAEISNTQAIGDLVSGLLALSNQFLELSRNPVAKVLLGIGSAVLVVVGSFAAYSAAVALARATTLAMVTANTQMAATAGAQTGVLRGLTAQFALLSLGTSRAKLAQDAYNKSLAASNGGILATGAALTRGAAAAGLFASALRGIVSATVVGAALTGIVLAVNAIGNAMKSSSDKAKEFYGDTSGLADALRKDTAAFLAGKGAISTHRVEVEKSSTKFAEWTNDLKLSKDAQIALNTTTGNTTRSIQEQTVAVGQSSAQFLANTLINNEKFQKSWEENGQSVIAAGGSFKGVFDAILRGDQGGEKYLLGLAAAQEKLATSSYDSAGNMVILTDSQVKNNLAVQKNIKGLISFNKAISTADTTLQDNMKTAAFADMAYKAAGVAAEGASVGVEDMADASADAAANLSNVVTNALAGTNALLSIGNASYALGTALAENGKTFDLYSQAGRANFAALQQTINAMVQAAGGDATVLTSYLQGLMQSLVATGVTGAEALGYVKSALAATGTTAIDVDTLNKSVAVTTAGLSQGYSAGLAKAATNTQKLGNASQKAAKELRSMKDYVDDLASVLDRAFEIRFEVSIAKDAIAEQIAQMKEDIKAKAKKDPISAADFFSQRTGRQAGRDAITTMYYEMKQAARDAAQAVKDANARIKQSQADIQGLKADKSVLEYQLMVANMYGDTVRAAQIQAELAKNTADTADAQAELNRQKKEAADAQAAQNKTLKGNSKSAINNRGAVRGLMSEYLDYIDTLRQSGASQKTIDKAVKDAKKNFLAQAVALGYSKDELAEYAAIFDDLGPAQKDSTKDTEDNAAAARDGRDAMRDLTKKYQEYVQALIDSGAPASVVEQAIKDGKKAIEDQGDALGMSKGEIDKYKAALDDIPAAIRKLPKNINIGIKKPSTNPIAQALAEYRQRHANDTIKVGTRLNTGGLTKGLHAYNAPKVPVTPKLPTKITNHDIAIRVGGVDSDVLKIRQSATIYKNMNIQGGITGASVSARGNGKNRNTAVAATGGHIGANGSVSYRASGGGIGGMHPGAPKGSDTVPAWLTPGEYVQNKSAVEYYGLPFMNALNNMQLPRYFAGGGTDGGGRGSSASAIQLVELLPTQLKQLASAVSAQVTLDGQVLAESTNRANARKNAQGAG